MSRPRVLACAPRWKRKNARQRVFSFIKYWLHESEATLQDDVIGRRCGVTPGYVERLRKANKDLLDKWRKEGEEKW